MLVTTAIYSSYTERHATSKKDISEHLNKNEVILVQNINLRQGEEKVEGSKTDPEIIDSYQTVCILLCHFSAWKIQSWGDERYLESTGSQQIPL